MLLYLAPDYALVICASSLSEVYCKRGLGCEMYEFYCSVAHVCSNGSTVLSHFYIGGREVYTSGEIKTKD